MAEALGIASGVAGLVSLTITVYGITYQYVSGVRGAPSAILRFLQEVQDLKTVLEKIEQMTKGLDDPEIFGDGGSCLLSVQDTNGYYELLESIRLDLGGRRDHSFRRKIKALTWPFSEKRTMGHIESLHRYLEIYKTALALDSLTVGKLTLGEMRENKISQHVTQVESILDWLSPLNMYQKQQDILSRRHSDTGAWLLSHAEFQTWLNGESSHRTLWCPGNPGTGKTVITSIVVDHLIKGHGSDTIRIAFVYCDYKNQANQKASDLVGCLARQLIGRPKSLPPQLERLHKDLEPQRRRPDLEELRRLLVTLCNERQITYIIVDALDECEAISERRHFLPLLASLPQGSTRLFVTSRPNNQDITHVFNQVPQIEIAAPPSDIQRFVAETMEERTEFIERVTPELKEQIVSTICTRASGMFLLAVLQIDRICVARTIKSIRSALNTMPRQLDELYRQTLERIQNQQGEDGEFAVRILGWITHAKRPLSVDELREGLAVSYDDEDHRELDEENLLSGKDLVDVCAGLVVIDSQSQVIRLVHYTTQEYFEKERLRLFENIDVEISMACLTYLSYDFATASAEDLYVSKVLASHPFLAYASLHWLSHVLSARDNASSSEVIAKAVTYVRNEAKLLFSTIVLRKILLRFRKKRVLPVEAASECGFLDLLKFLLHHTTVSQAVLDSSLRYASSEGHAKIVELLLLRGAIVHSTIRSSDWDMNALHVACKGGHVHIVGLLIERSVSVDVNLPDRWMWTPLHHAAQGGHSSIVYLLLAKSAKPNARTAFGLTACHLAASSGDAFTVQLLLDAGCDLKLTSRDKKRTALHSAAEGPHVGVIRLLLFRGADVSAQDHNACNAFDLIDPAKRTNDVKGVFSAHMEASFVLQATTSQTTKEIPQEVGESTGEEAKAGSSKFTPDTAEDQPQPEVAPNTSGGDSEVISTHFDFSKQHQGEENADQLKEEDEARRAEESKSSKEWLRRYSEKTGKSKPRSWAWSAATGIFNAAVDVIGGTLDSDDVVDDQDTKFIHEDYALFFAPFEVLSRSKNVAQDTGTSEDTGAQPASAKDAAVADVDDDFDFSRESLSRHVPLVRLIEPTPPSSEPSTPFLSPQTVSYHPLTGGFVEETVQL